MFPHKSLCLFVLSASVGVNAYASLLSRGTGKLSLAISTRINAAGIGNLAARDRARAQALRQPSRLSSTTGSINATNNGVSYTTEIGIGTPPTNYTLLIDAAIDVTWLGGNKQYVPTSSSVEVGETAACSGYGEEWLDTITLSPDLVITGQPICVSDVTSTPSNIDGNLGLLTSSNGLPTFVQTLYTEGKVSQEVVGIFFAPASEPEGSGELTFGGYDAALTTSAVSYVPLTTTSPSSDYWGFDQSISYGSTTILSSTAGIVDTGTTLILIATNAFQEYQSVTGATMDETTGLLTVTSAQYANLQNLAFEIGSMQYNLTPNGQIWPRSLNTMIGGTTNAIYLIVASIGTPSGSGLDFINGYTFIERFYTVLDTTNERVGFATTAYTDATSN